MKINLIDNSNDLVNTPLNRGELFGDGFFTTGLIDAGQIINLQSHIERIKLSAIRLKFKTLAIESIKQQLMDLARLAKRATFRLNVCRTQLQRGYAISTHQEVSLTLFISPWTPLPEADCYLKIAETPISVNTLFAGIKHLNRLDSVMAATEIRSPTNETLLCQNDNIICGSRSNLFVYLNQHWQTPNLDACGIEGITKKRLIENARTQGIEIKISRINKQSIKNWQAAFVTNSLIGMWPVKQIGNKPLDTQFVQQLQSQLNFSR